MTITEQQWSATNQGRASDRFIQTTVALSVVYAAAELGSMITNKLGPLAQWAVSNGDRMGVNPDTVDSLKAEQKYLDMLDPELDQSRSQRRHHHRRVQCYRGIRGTVL